MLSVNNLNVFYGGFEALRSVSLEVHENEIVALLGSNGAGKTTTINSISGLTEVRNGTISFDGENIDHLPAYLRVIKGIVQVPEGRKLFPTMSILDNLLIGSCIPKAKEKREKSLNMVYELFPKLYERRHQMAGTLSGGEQQMCAIARALMTQPKILMLDEPSLGLAPVVVEKIFDAILKINKLGTSILLVEQNVLDALDIATTGYVIETGEVVMKGSNKDLLADEGLRKAYFGI